MSGVAKLSSVNPIAREALQKVEKQDPSAEDTVDRLVDFPTIIQTDKRGSKQVGTVTLRGNSGNPVRCNVFRAMPRGERDEGYIEAYVIEGPEGKTIGSIQFDIMKRNKRGNGYEPPFDLRSCPHFGNAINQEPYQTKVVINKVNTPEHHNYRGVWDALSQIAMEVAEQKGEGRLMTQFAAYNSHTAFYLRGFLPMISGDDRAEYEKIESEIVEELPRIMKGKDPDTTGLGAISMFLPPEWLTEILANSKRILKS